MSKVLVSGSLAYDNIMSYDGLFKDSFVDEKLDKLSLSFLAYKHEQYFGGCSANIAYSLAFLGHSPNIFAVAGSDFDKYKIWLEKSGVGIELVDTDPDLPTAAAYILSDNAGNQISTFSIAAMGNKSLAMSFDFEASDFDLAIVAAGLPERMIAVANFCSEKGLEYIFDPGQAMSALNAEQLMDLIKKCKGVIVNEYEAQLLVKRLGMELDDIASLSEFLIVTAGEDSVKIFAEGEIVEVKPLKVVKPADVTGCGDAFRAGFLHGLLTGADLKLACQKGCLVASYALNEMGTQNHSFDLEQFNSAFSRAY